jgi:hypothetical protein
MLSWNDPPLPSLPSLVVGPSTKSDYWCWVLCSTIAVNAGQITSMTHMHVIGAHRSHENTGSRDLLPFLSLRLQLFVSLSLMVRTDISRGVNCSRVDGLKWYLVTAIFQCVVCLMEMIMRLCEAVGFCKNWASFAHQTSFLGKCKCNISFSSFNFFLCHVNNAIRKRKVSKTNLD